MHGTACNREGSGEGADTRATIHAGVLRDLHPRYSARSTQPDKHRNSLDVLRMLMPIIYNVMKS
eukprot:9401779-Prorocentrum_lima.AAC.1